jgi:hypothetical protein
MSFYIREGLEKTSLKILLEEEEKQQEKQGGKTPSAFSVAAKGFVGVKNSLEAAGMSNVAKLAATGNKTLANNIIDASANDKNAITMYYLAAQFGASLIRLFTGINDIIEAGENPDDKKLKDVLGDNLKTTISKFFYPSGGFLGKAQKILDRYQELSASGKEKSTNESDELEEGLGDAIKGALKSLFSSGPPKDSKSTVGNLKSLFNGNIADALLKDLQSDELTVGKFKELLKTIEPSLKQLDFRPPPAQQQKKDEEKPSGADGEENAPEAKGSDKKSKTAGSREAGDGAANVKKVSANIEKIKGLADRFSELNSIPSKNRSKKQREELSSIASKLSGVKAESVIHDENILIERWQLLAGIEK